MVTLRKLHPMILVCYGVLGIADLCLTLYLIRASGGSVYESNPIAGEWLLLYGSAGLAIYKILAMVLFAGCTILVSLRRPNAGARLLKVACGITGVVVVYSAFLASNISKTPTQYYAEKHGAVSENSVTEEAEPAPAQLSSTTDGSGLHD
jgi:membrane-associated HD superfamily phosphohydrolase